MQIPSSTAQTATISQPHTPLQTRKMDGSGNGLGLQNGSNSSTTTLQSSGSASSAPLSSNSTFSIFA